MKHNIFKSTLLSFSLVAVLVGLSGCKAPESSSASVDPEQSLNSIQLENLEPQIDEMEVRLAAATKEINQLSVLGLSTLSSSTGTQAQGLADKLSQVFNRLTDVIKQLVAKKNELKVQIESISAKLDLQNPQHVKLKEKIDRMLAYLNDLDNHLRNLQTQLITKIDAKVAQIDAALLKMDPNSPLTWIVQVAWPIVKEKVVLARDQLAAIQI